MTLYIWVTLMAGWSLPSPPRDLPSCSYSMVNYIRCLSITTLLFLLSHVQGIYYRSKHSPFFFQQRLKLLFPFHYLFFCIVFIYHSFSFMCFSKYFHTFPMSSQVTSIISLPFIYSFIYSICPLSSFTYLFLFLPICLSPSTYLSVSLSLSLCLSHAHAHAHSLHLFLSLIAIVNLTYEYCPPLPRVYLIWTLLSPAQLYYPGETQRLWFVS